MIKLLRKLRAKINRTFVADCPKCGKHFYGHTAYGQQIKIDKKNYRYICSSCHKESVK